MNFFKISRFMLVLLLAGICIKPVVAMDMDWDPSSLWQESPDIDLAISSLNDNPNMLDDLALPQFDSVDDYQSYLSSSQAQQQELQQQLQAIQQQQASQQQQQQQILLLQQVTQQQQQQMLQAFATHEARGHAAANSSTHSMSSQQQPVPMTDDHAGLVPQAAESHHNPTVDGKDAKQSIQQQAAQQILAQWDSAGALISASANSNSNSAAAPKYAQQLGDDEDVNMDSNQEQQNDEDEEYVADEDNAADKKQKRKKSAEKNPKNQVIVRCAAQNCAIRVLKTKLQRIMKELGKKRVTCEDVGRTCTDKTYLHNAAQKLKTEKKAPVQKTQNSGKKRKGQPDPKEDDGKDSTSGKTTPVAQPKTKKQKLDPAPAPVGTDGGFGPMMVDGDQENHGDEDEESINGEGDEGNDEDNAADQKKPQKMRRGDRALIWCAKHPGSTRIQVQKNKLQETMERLGKGPKQITCEDLGRTCTYESQKSRAGDRTIIWCAEHPSSKKIEVQKKKLQRIMKELNKPEEEITCEDLGRTCTYDKKQPKRKGDRTIIRCATHTGKKIRVQKNKLQETMETLNKTEKELTCEDLGRTCK